jgi:hypothetical protein
MSRLWVVSGNLTDEPFTGGLRLGDTLELALAAKVRLEFGKHAQPVEKAFAGGGAGVDRLLGRLQRGATGPHRADDVLQVTDAPGLIGNDRPQNGATAVK